VNLPQRATISQAWAALNTMKSRLDPACMLQAMDNFIEAAANYAKDKAFALEKKCLDNANLIQLQVRLLSDNQNIVSSNSVLFV